MKFRRVLPVLVMLATAATVAPADQKTQPSKDANKTEIKKTVLGSWDKVYVDQLIEVIDHEVEGR